MRATHTGVPLPAALSAQALLVLQQTLPLPLRVALWDVSQQGHENSPSMYVGVWVCVRARASVRPFVFGCVVVGVHLCQGDCGGFLRGTESVSDVSHHGGGSGRDRSHSFSPACVEERERTLASAG